MSNDEVIKHVENVREAIGSLRWLVNNAHNAGTDAWNHFEAASEKDVHKGLESLAELERELIEYE